MIELVSDSDAELEPGDRGVVRGISPGGEVDVEWERGFCRPIDPRSTTFRALTA